MRQAVGKWVAGHRAVLVVAALVAWILFVGVSIWRSPLPGSASPTALSGAFRSAVTSESEDQLSDLFKPDSIGDTYAQSFLERIGKADLSALNVTVTTDQQGAELVVRASGPDGADLCTAWPMVQQKGRWVIDGTPALTTACTRSP